MPQYFFDNPLRVGLNNLKGDGWIPLFEARNDTRDYIGSRNRARTNNKLSGDFLLELSYEFLESICFFDELRCMAVKDICSFVGTMDLPSLSKSLQ